MNEIKKVETGASCKGCANSTNLAKNLYCYFPNSITLTASVVAADGTTELRFADACGLFDDLGVGTGATVEQFDVRGQVSASAVRNFLQTHAGRIKMINYKCDLDPDQLNNKIKIFNTSIDEQSGSAKIFDVAVDQRNTQFTQGLQTVYPYKGEAFLTNTSGFLISTDDIKTKTIELTLQFDQWKGYTDIMPDCM